MRRAGTALLAATACLAALPGAPAWARGSGPGEPGRGQGAVVRGAPAPRPSSAMPMSRRGRTT
ncbi:hypothetical protein [Streptomyces rapamycinicus]|uniref:hypothetical protein n=1 Tax=Streptomyces rapamycinicus TaxID=1226757 RepID=UPI003D7C2522